MWTSRRTGKPKRDPSTAFRAAQTPRDRRSGAPTPLRVALVIGIARERYTANSHPSQRARRMGTRNTHCSRFVWRKDDPASEFRLLFAESVTTP